MIIKSCEIGSFGKLSDKTIVLDDRITVIRGKNEAGKTTLSTFIKYVLYGYIGKGRDESGNEKLKYSPRDGSQSFGALVMKSEDGSIYRAERRGDGRNGSWRIIDARGARCFEGTEIGEALYGTDAVTFSKSAFVGQGDIHGSGMKDIGASLEKVLLESDEDTDFDGIRKELVSERNGLYNKMRETGLVFELCARLDELTERKKKSEGDSARLVSSRHLAKETERKINENKQRLEGLYAELENINAYEAHAQMEKIRAAREKCNASETEYERLLSQSERGGIIPDRAYVDDLQSALVEYSAAKNAEERAKSELSFAREKAEQLPDGVSIPDKSRKLLDCGSDAVLEKLTAATKLQSEIKKYKLLAVLFLCLVLTFPLTIAMLVLASRAKKELASLLSEYGFLDLKELSDFYDAMPSILKLMDNSENRVVTCERELDLKKNSLDEAKKQLCKLLEMIGEVCGDVDLCEYVTSIIPGLKNTVSECEKAYARLSSDKSALDALLSVSNVSELEDAERKMKTEPPERKRDVVEKAIKYDEGANALLAKRLSDLNAEVAALEAQNVDPAAIEAEMLKVKEELQDAQLRLDAAELAIELVDESRAALRVGVLPKVSELAGELFSKFTGEKYRSLFFDKDLGLRVLSAEESETRNASVLSAGSADAAYIALRIALARVLFKEKPTFVFDESFVRCDDERLVKILGVLEKLSEEFQIVILTCHEREEKILEGKCKTVVLD